MKLNISVSTVPKEKIIKGSRVAVRTAKNEWYCGIIESISPGNITVAFNDGDVIELPNFKTIKLITKRGAKKPYTDETINLLLLTPVVKKGPGFPIKVIPGGLQINNVKKFSRGKFKRNEELQKFLAKYLPLVAANKGAIFSSDELVTPERFKLVAVRGNDGSYSVENKKVKDAVGRMELYYLPYAHLWSKTGNWSTLQVYNSYKPGTYVVIENTSTSRSQDELTIMLVAGNTEYTAHKREWT